MQKLIWEFTEPGFKRRLYSGVSDMVCGFVTGNKDLQTEFALRHASIRWGAVFPKSENSTSTPETSCKSTSTAHIRAGALPQRVYVLLSVQLSRLKEKHQCQTQKQFKHI